jgi:hypothetical protein
VCIFIALVVFMASLGTNFGAGAHDGFILYPENLTAVLIPPEVVNGVQVLRKPQNFVIVQTWPVHYSYLVQKGFYAVYAFCLGMLFVLLAAIIIHKMVGSNKALGGDGAMTKKLKRTIFSILIVAIPVALGFVVLFVFVVLEISTHRHADRWEYFLTQQLCSEIWALTFLMIHYWRAELRSYSRARGESASATTSSSGKSISSTSSGMASSSSGVDDMEMNEKKAPKEGAEQWAETGVINL